MNYNPYDLVPMIINGQDIHGRPFEFDSDVANQRDMTNAVGDYVKPTKLSTCCPSCGDGMEVEVSLGEPPFTAVAVDCKKCSPDIPDVVDPFMNPIKEERVNENELDPLVHDLNSNVEDVDSTVADRLNIKPSEKEAAKTAAKTTLKTAKKSSKKPKKSTKKKKTNDIEPEDEKKLEEPSANDKGEPSTDEPLKEGSVEPVKKTETKESKEEQQEQPEVEESKVEEKPKVEEQDDEELDLDVDLSKLLNQLEEDDEE